MAHGIADNMLITTYLSMKAPVFIAPAMDLDMYSILLQANMKTLWLRNEIIEPEVGSWQADWKERDVWKNLILS